MSFRKESKVRAERITAYQSGPCLHDLPKSSCATCKDDPKTFDRLNQSRPRLRGEQRNVSND